MTNLSILKQFYPIQTGVNNSVLRKKSLSVNKLTSEIKQFGLDLIDLMYEYDGVGLAAPQVGKNIRMLALVQLKKIKGEYEIKGEYVMVNPKIVFKSESLEIDTEACLSLPGEQGKVERSSEVQVDYLDLDGNKQSLRAKGYNARIIQHEFDHLDGILYIDKLVK